AADARARPGRPARAPRGRGRPRAVSPPTPARLADDGYFARGHVTLDVDDRIRIHAMLFSQSQRAVDVGMVEMAARIWLEPDARRLPLTPEGLVHLREGRRADERPVEAEASLEHGRVTTDAASGARGGDDARMARPDRGDDITS